MHFYCHQYRHNLTNSYLNVIAVSSNQVKLYLFLQNMLKKKIENMFLVPNVTVAIIHLIIASK